MDWLLHCPSHTLCMSEGENVQQPPPVVGADASQADSTSTSGAQEKERCRRLTYNRGPRDSCYECKVKIVSQCMQYKASLFGTGKCSEIYKMVADDLNKYHPELFSSSLKENSFKDVWNKALKQADAQQQDKEAKHHQWYN